MSMFHQLAAFDHHGLITVINVRALAVGATAIATFYWHQI